MNRSRFCVSDMYSILGELPIAFFPGELKVPPNAKYFIMFGSRLSSLTSQRSTGFSEHRESWMPLLIITSRYELVTYKWPHWLRAQTEKQRIIWA
jgi:hypothetical protein